MNYPQQATVNTGKFTHPDWKNGETVWVLGSEGDVCRIARNKDSQKAEGTLRRDVLVFKNES